LSSVQVVLLMLCFLVVAIGGFDTAAIGFIAPAIRADWTLTPAQLAGLFGLMAGAFAIGPVARSARPLTVHNRRLSKPTRSASTNASNSFLAPHEKGWKNAKHRQQWRSTLKTYASPAFGHVPVADVNTSLVLNAIEPIWFSKPETASRLRGRIERILSWAKVRGYRTGEYPALWRGHLDQTLPPPNKGKRHHKALPYTELPAFLTELRSRPASAARALEFVILTAARTGEVIGATWEEPAE
jgi:integrase